MEKARFKKLIGGVIVGGVWVGLFSMNSATAYDVDCAVMQKPQKNEKVKADASPTEEKDPFESIRHIRPKPDKKAPKFPWTPDKKYLTDAEYEMAQEQIKYWNEYYHDVYKPLEDLKKKMKNQISHKGAQTNVPLDILGLLMHQKGVRYERNPTYKNMIPVDYNSLDGSLFPMDPAGVELVKDYAIWGRPGWMVKQETLKKYPLSRLEKMNPKQLAGVIQKVIDGRAYYYSGLIRLLEQDLKEKKPGNLPNWSSLRCQHEYSICIR